LTGKLGQGTAAVLPQAVMAVRISGASSAANSSRDLLR